MTQPAASTVNVVNPEGKLVSIPAEDENRALASGKYSRPGLAPAADEAPKPGELGTFEAANEFGVAHGLSPLESNAGAAAATLLAGPGGSLAGWQAGGFYGGTGGLGPAAVANALGRISPEMRAHYTSGLQNIEQASPNAYAGGIIGGNVARDLVLANVGASPGLAAESGVGRATAGLASRGALGRAAAAGVRAGAASGLESALYGASTEASSEEMLGDHELNASKILVAGGKQGVLGAILGGATGFTGSLASSGLNAAKNYTAQGIQKMLTNVKDGARSLTNLDPESDLVKNYVKSAAAVSGGDEAAIQELLTNPEARRVAAFDAPKIRDQASRDVVSHLNQMMESTDALTAEAKGSLKRGYIEKAVLRGNEPEAAAETTKTIDSLLGHIDEMQAQADTYGSKRTLAQLRKFTELKAEEANAAIQAGDNAGQFAALDDLKRGVGKYTSAASQVTRRQTDALSQMQSRNLAERMQGVYEDMRGSLENEAVWGKAASDQKAINEAWTKQIDASKQFQKLTTIVGRDPADPWVELRRVDPEKADAYVRGLMNPNKDLIHQGIRNYVDASEDLSKAISSAYELPADVAPNVQKLSSAASGFRSSLDKTTKALTWANLLEEQVKAEGEGGLLGLALAHTLGPLGTTGALAYGAVSRPGHLIRQLASLEQSSSTGYIAKMLKVADEKIGAAASGLAGDVTPSIGVAEESSVPLRARFSSAVRAVGRAQSDPYRTMQHVQATDLPGAPNTSSALALSATTSLSYLASRVPPNSNHPAFGVVDDNPRATMPEMARYMRIHDAIENPQLVFDHMAAGVVYPEEVQALRDNHPKLFEALQQQTITKVAKRQAGPEPLTTKQLLRLGIVLDIPTDPSLKQDVLTSLQANLVNRNGAKPTEDQQNIKPPSKPIELEDSKSSGFDQIETR